VYVHEAVANALVAEDVEVLFGLVGDANLFIVESFLRHPGGRYVALVNESNAVQAAIGYAEVTDRLGVATVTHGPGLTNTATSLIEAAKAHTPLVLVAGDTVAADRDHFQKIAQREFVLATGAGFVPVRSPDTITADLRTAVRLAVSQRRPVVLNLPIDLLWLPAGDQVAGPSAVPPPMPDPDSLDLAVGVIAAARRPLILAGRGACSDRDRDALLRLAGRLDAPVATTLKARDLFAGYPADIGIFGTLSHSAALSVINDSDAVIAFGASLNEWTTAHGGLLASRPLIHVDESRAMFGWYIEPTVAVWGQAATVAEELCSLLDEAGVRSSRFGAHVRSVLMNEQSGSAPADRAGAPVEGVVDIFAGLELVDRAVSPDRVLVFDSGRFLRAAFAVLHTKAPGGFVHTVNFGSIGLGLGTAIGAAIASPDRRSVLVTGDGGFMLGGVAELATVARHQLPMTILVLNDGAYGAEHIQLTRHNLDPGLSMFTWPSFAAIAEAFGLRGYTATSLAELADALEAAGTDPGPCLIDIKLDPAAIPSKGD
jgi:acetolactate synthase I/II/III large subunit